MKKLYLNKLKINGSGLGLIIIHSVGLIGLVVYLSYQSPSWQLIAASVAFLYITLLGITAGYHRLFAHPTYKTYPLVESIILWVGGATLQGSVLTWAHDHRLHHKNVDTKGDPYDITRGFLYAHVWWIFKYNIPWQDNVVSDLSRNPRVVWQQKNYLWVVLTGNLTFCLWLGWLTGDLLGALIIGGVVRLLFSFHITWFINSLAHYWGERSYSKELSARDNYILAMITVGEGYHNYHHVFPGDFRNGIKWYHVDAGKWLIWSLSKLGLAYGLHKYETQKIVKKLINLDESLLLKLIVEMKSYPERLKEILSRSATDSILTLEQTIKRLSESLRIKQEQITDLVAKKKNKGNSLLKKQIKLKLKESRNSFEADWKIWSDLLQIILGVKMAKA